MSFVVALALVLSGIVAGGCLLLFKRQRWVGMVAGALTLAGLMGWFLHPVCRPIAAADLALFDPPVEQREETGMIGQRVFQEQDGQWLHCKTWVARKFFF